MTFVHYFTSFPSQSFQPSFLPFPSSATSTKSPIISCSPPSPSDPSLHGIQTSVGEGSRTLSYGHGNARAGSVLSFSGFHGGADILGGRSLVSRYQALGATPLARWFPPRAALESGPNFTTNMGSGVRSLHPGPCLTETTRQLWPRGPFNLGSKHGVCGDNREYFVVLYSR